MNGSLPESPQQSASNPQGGKSVGRGEGSSTRHHNNYNYYNEYQGQAASGTSSKAQQVLRSGGQASQQTIDNVFNYPSQKKSRSVKPQMQKQPFNMKLSKTTLGNSMMGGPTPTNQEGYPVDSQYSRMVPKMHNVRLNEHPVGPQSAKKHSQTANFQPVFLNSAHQANIQSQQQAKHSLLSQAPRKSGNSPHQKVMLGGKVQ